MENKLGKAIKMRREELGLSLRDLADLTGLSHSYIDKLEKGIDQRSKKPVHPTTDTLIRLQKGLGIPMFTLLDAVEMLNTVSYDDVLMFLNNTRHPDGTALTKTEKENILEGISKHKK